MKEPQGITNTDLDLYENIQKALNKVTSPDQWIVVDPDDGTVSHSDLFPFDADDLNNKYNADKDKDDMVDVRQQDFSGKGIPDNPDFSNPYISQKLTGSEHQMIVISKEMLTHIVSNAQITMKERMDKLESDYNNLLVGLATAAATYSASPTPPGFLLGATAGASLLSAVTQGGGATRSVTTEALKLKNETGMVDGVIQTIHIK